MRLVKCSFFITIVLLFLELVVADHAKVYKIKPCDTNTYYPVIVNNVLVKEQQRQIFVSGSLSTDDDLIAPISASLTVKRYVKWAQSWIPLLCIDGIGSCTYNDLCSYGISPSESCPNKFEENDVPCRCPIPQGHYTMKPEKKMYLFTLPKKVYLFNRKVETFSTPVAGIYWIEARVTSNNTLLSCYQFYIDYNDENEKFEINDVVPSINLLR